MSQLHWNCNMKFFDRVRARRRRPLAQPADNALPAPPESATALYDEMFLSDVPVSEMPTKVARAKEHPFEDRELTLSWTSDRFAALKNLGFFETT